VQPSHWRATFEFWKVVAGRINFYWMRHMIGLPYLQKQNSWQSQWLLFATTNKRYTAYFSMFLNFKFTAKQHHYHYSGKTIVGAGNSQRSKSLHSHLHSTCALFQVETQFANWKTSGYQSIFNIISPSLKAFPFCAIASLKLKLNLVHSECRFCKGYHFLFPLAMTSTIDGL